jgi:hypothetical protein
MPTTFLEWIHVDRNAIETENLGLRILLDVRLDQGIWDVAIHKMRISTIYLIN